MMSVLKGDTNRLAGLRCRVVFGKREAVEQVIPACGWQIKTAFISAPTPLCLSCRSNRDACHHTRLCIPVVPGVSRTVLYHTIAWRQMYFSPVI